MGFIHTFGEGEAVNARERCGWKVSGAVGACKRGSRYQQDQTATINKGGVMPPFGILYFVPVLIINSTKV